jgi:hypothetical protein
MRMQQNDIAIVSNRHLPFLRALLCCIGLQGKWRGGSTNADENEDAK